MLYNIYLAYFAYLMSSLKKRENDSSLTQRKSELIHTLVLLLQLHIILVSIHWVLDNPVNLFLYTSLMGIIAFINYRHLRKFKTIFMAQLGFQCFDDEDKLMMTVYLRVLLIVDIILILTFIAANSA